MDKCGCCKKAPEVGPRPVYANELELNSVYRNNKVTNSKYTFLNFLPKNLFEQFSKFMNAYFVLIAVLQLWAAITPVNPITTWLPLAAIFGLSAIKEGVDDYHRHKADRRFNSVRPWSRFGFLAGVATVDVFGVVMIDWGMIDWGMID